MFILIWEIACVLKLKEMFGIRDLTGFSEKMKLTSHDISLYVAMLKMFLYPWVIRLRIYTFPAKMYIFYLFCHQALYFTITNRITLFTSLIILQNVGQNPLDARWMT